MSPTIRLLYAEDNPQDADLTRSHFAGHAPDFELEMVGTGRECLERLSGPGFDVLLLDYRLPDMDGLVVLRMLFRHGARLPVVLVTGTGDEELVVKALRLGAVNYVAKQGGYLETLPDLLRDAVERHRREQSQGQPGAASPRRVLYVEHWPMDVELTLRHFAEAAPDFVLDVVSTAADALARLEVPPPCDAALVDLRLPDQSGLDFVREAQRRRLPLPPFIMISGKGDEAAAIASLQLGAADYIAKREGYLSQLPHTIDQAIAHRRAKLLNEQLQTELAQRKRAEHQALKRAEELRAFYSLTELSESKGITLDELYAEFTNVLPKSWQYPEVACARIVVDDRTFCTDSFAESPWMQSASITANGLVVGKVDVGYLEERPDEDEGPFLKEERQLIDAIAVRLGRIRERTQTREALVRLNAQHELILSSAAEGILGLDLLGNHSFVNPAAAKMLGYETEELLGRPSHSTWHHTKPDGSPYLTEECVIQATCRDGGIRRASTEVFWRKDGTSFPVEYTSTPIYEQGRLAGAVLTFADITERQRAADALRASEEHAQQLVTHLPTGVVVHAADSSIILSNPMAAQLLGLSEAQMQGKVAMDPAWRFLCADGTNMPLDEYPVTAVIKSRRPLRGLVVGVNRSTTADVVWVMVNAFPEFDATGALRQVVVAFNDVTEVKRAAITLQANEFRLRRFYESGLLGVIYWTMDGRIVDANDKFLEMVGYTREDLLQGRIAWVSMTPPEYRHLDAASVAELKATGVNAKPFEKEYIRKDGTRVPILLAGAMLDEEHFNGVAFVLDITERRRAAHALEASETRYRRLFEAAKDGILILDADTGAVVDVNPFLVELLGFPREYFLGRKLWDLGLFKDIAASQAAFAQLREKAYVRYDDLPLKTSDGRQVAVEFVSNVYAVDGQTVIQCNIRDITERQRAAETLRRLSARHQAMLEAVPDIVMEVDANKVYTWANAAGYAFFGPDVIGQEAATYFIGEQATYTQVQPLFAGAEATFYVESWQRRQDGQQRLLGWRCRVLKDRDGQVTGALSTARDITAERQAAETLAAAELRYRRLFEAAQDGILLLDADTGQVVDANRFLVDLLGYPYEQLLGKLVWELGFLKDIVANQAKFSELQQKGYVRYENLPLETNDGRLIEVEFVSHVYLVNRQRVIQCNIRDITERQRLAREHAKLEEQFRQAQKMEAIGRLAGGVAHDVNNLMTVVGGYSELALAGCPPHSPLRAQLEEIRAAGAQTADLARQLLAFGRRQVLQPRTIELHAALTHLERMLHRLIGEDIALTVAPAAGSTWVTLDPIQFEQVVMNLAVNARDAMPKGGALTMAAAAVAADADFLARHPEALPGGYVRLTVSDTGCGMTDEVKARLFEPFFTTKDPGKGTGLGLATVYGIVTQSGGFIDVDSARGRGSRFVLHFPAAAAPAAAAPAVTEPAAALAPAPVAANILVVEDNQALRELLLAVLGERGYAVVDAADGQAAVALAAKYAGTIHLLLTDVVLPGMSGPELAQQVQGRFPALRVLFMSGYAGEAVAQHGVLDPDTAFIAKPFTVDELAAKIRDTLERPGKTTAHGTKHRR